MKVLVSGVEYEVPQEIIDKVQTGIEENPEGTAWKILNEVLQFNDDGVVESPEAIKFRVDNNLPNDDVAISMTLAVVFELLGIQIIK